MNIGKMDKEILLQKPDDKDDAQGGRDPKYNDVISVWAEFLKPKFNTQEVAGGIASVGIREVRIRHRSDVIKGWRFKYGSTRIFNIEHVYDPNRSETMLVVKEVSR